MKSKLVLIIILVLALVCVPCLVSLAEGETDSSGGETTSLSSDEGESSSPVGSDSSGSDEDDGSDSTGSEDSDEPESSSKETDSSSEPESSSSGSGFKGDPVQGKTPKFADLKLGDGDPDDGKDFNLKPEDNDGMAEVVIRNTEAKGMKGNDNFHIKFDGCELWLPIEIPASCVEDDHINSKLVVSYGPADDGVLSRVTDSVQSSHILQTFTLALTSYDVKGQSSDMNTFDGKIKFVCQVNAASVNQFKRDGKLALMVYNSESRSLSTVEYELDADKGEMTVYTSNSGSFFMINANDIDLSAPIKLNSNAPFLKVVLYAGTFVSICASIALIVMLIVRSKKQKLKNAKH
ncbi:MAG: hypothetical protein J5756_03340 [Clostridia bacterium]|nr:hypothetical protein [Clostridia bacterium]